MANEWMEEVRAVFPDWQTAEALARWPNSRSRLSVGQQVRGVVIARAPFGVWLDIKAGHPALLHWSQLATRGTKWATFEDYSNHLPALGATVEVRIYMLGDRGEIGVSQQIENPPRKAAD